MTIKVIITGANSGIGKALALEYAKKGAVLGLIARDSDKLGSLQKILPCPSQIFSIDVTDIAQCRWAAEEFMAQHGIPDVVIANAGISQGTLTENFTDLKIFEEIIKTNLFGVQNTFYPFIQPFKKRKRGQLVGISSVAGIRGIPGSGAYSASKAALTNYLESLRIEMLEFNIYVSTIAPGYIRTPMTNVNNFTMPFLINSDKAAKKIIQSIEKKTRFTIIPFPMNIIGRIIRILPCFLWDCLARNAPRKKRVSNKS